jgi:UDP-glucose 4-epimerase
MKTLVTGGCGFIGSHMVDRLLNEGHEVLVIDNLSTGRSKNLDHQKDNSKLSIHIHSIADFSNILPLFEGIDQVYHLAALADIVPSIEKPMDYHNSNVNGTICVLEACRKHKVKRIIYAASSSCYGIPEAYPTSEREPIQAQYPYAVTKYLGEEYCMYWQKVYNMNITSMRFFNVFGPRSRTSGTYGAVFGVFLAQKINEKPFTVVGDGSQTRDFTFVTDVVDACYTAAQGLACVGEVLNVGSGNTYSINSLVGLLGGEVVYIPKRPGEPDCTFADTAKIKEMLGWSAKVPFAEGVRIMLENIDYWREAPVWEPQTIEKATEDWFKYLGNPAE